MDAWTPLLDREQCVGRPVRPELFSVAPGGSSVSGPPDSDPMATVGLLDDAVVRTVLEATACRPRSAADLAELADVSRQTVYRRLQRLQAAGLVDERMRPRADGHHETAYEATFEELRVELTDEGLSFTLELQSSASDAADELTKLWENFRS